ncbi:MAG: GNAT family N-acetyltransferase [Deltaproteobacteria bacterium]|nr:GNAT family N-acetyltransferase [Deltaproteobacteria bacterium]
MQPRVNIETKRLALVLPSPSMAPRAVAFFAQNRAHLEPWEPPRPSGYYTESWWRERLERGLREFEADLSLRLMLFWRGQPESPVLGTVNFTSFVRGALQACSVGYSLDRNLQGQGLMTEALRGAIPYVFGDLGFHRISAGYLPTNERSGRVLRRLGFVVEGFARDYLYIGGAFRDHVLTALTNPSAMAPRGL